MPFVRSSPIRRRGNVLGDTPLDYLRNALPSWAGGMQITPNQAAQIADDQIKMAPRAKLDRDQIIQQVLDQSQKHPATLPGDSTSPWAWLTSNSGGTGMPKWGLIGFGTIALWGTGIVGSAWLLSKWLETKSGR